MGQGESLQERVGEAEALLEAKRPLLNGIIRKNGCGQDSEDILQEFYISLLVHPIPEYIENVDAYLSRAVTHDIIDMRRKQNAYQGKLQRMSIHYERCSVHNVINEIITKDEAAQMFHLAQTKLPHYLWTVIKLRYKQDVTVEEISQTLGIKKHVVRVYLSMALQRIREHLRIKRSNKC